MHITILYFIQIKELKKFIYGLPKDKFLTPLLIGDLVGDQFTTAKRGKMKRFGDKKDTENCKEKKMEDSLVVIGWSLGHVGIFNY